jgi:hypothetical protein
MTFAAAARELVSIYLDIDLRLEALVIREFNGQNTRGPADVRLIALVDPTVKRNRLESGIQSAALG